MLFLSLTIKFEGAGILQATYAERARAKRVA